ncbi:hypothetical protein RFI_02792 [Reticulomyxa filosa]|uniref:Transmembrane protein n=1 Tax=Reticulomyxa filosa TaxID=46433 RepID=X6P862_RETFI|nr:hypothetical protein RFI_02792 [Reticulomyxa filosa]|eukprot:ETO34303.1 hypothetical protein RFI_02792 [Reticulomyxa filosa]
MDLLGAFGLIFFLTFDTFEKAEIYEVDFVIIINTFILLENEMHITLEDQVFNYFLYKIMVCKVVQTDLKNKIFLFCSCHIVFCKQRAKSMNYLNNEIMHLKLFLSIYGSIFSKNIQMKRQKQQLSKKLQQVFKIYCKEKNSALLFLVELHNFDKENKMKEFDFIFYIIYISISE